VVGQVESWDAFDVGELAVEVFELVVVKFEERNDALGFAIGALNLATVAAYYKRVVPLSGCLNGGNLESYPGAGIRYR
jgi:hypothetical protein